MRLTDIEASVPAPIFLDGSGRWKDGGVRFHNGEDF